MTRLPPLHFNALFGLFREIIVVKESALFTMRRILEAESVVKSPMLLLMIF